MNAQRKQESVPLNMRCLVMLASFLCLPVLVPEQCILKEKSILFSFAGHLAGPFLALAPVSYQKRFIIGSLCAVVPHFLHNALLQAFFLGLVASYYRMAIDLFCAALCVKTPKNAVLIMSSLVACWISFITFFSLHFCPSLAATVCSPAASFVFAFAGAALAYMYIIETPEEIFARLRETSSKSVVYEELYSCISYLNGPGKSSPDAFREEYKTFLNAKSLAEESSTLKEKLAASFISINISFIYVAFQRAAGINNTHSLGRIFLGAMQLFSWSFKYSDSPATYYAVIIPPAALYFVCVSTNNIQDVFLVLVMLLGAGLVPKSSGQYAQRPVEIACSRSIQYVLVLVTFLGVASTVL